MHQSAAPVTRPDQSDIPYREAYSVPEIAVLLGGSSERWVWALVDKGDLPSIKIGGRRLVARADLLAFIDSLRADERQAREAAAERHVARLALVQGRSNTQGTGGAGTGSGSGGSGTNTGGSGGTRPTKSAT